MEREATTTRVHKRNTESDARDEYKNFRIFEQQQQQQQKKKERGPGVTSLDHRLGPD